MTVGFEPLLNHLPAWLLVLFRLTGIFLFAPLFGSVLIPGRVKVLLAVGLSFCVYPLLLDPGSQSAVNLLPLVERGLTFWGLVGIVSAELGIGLLIGYGATLPLVGMQLGGRMISQQIGLGLAEVFNPVEEQAGIISRLFFLLALLVFLMLGGHHVLLRTLIDCFQTVPPGSFRIDDRALGLIWGMLNSMLKLALQVAAPLLCLIFLETIAIGFIARTVPQMNILSIGFAVRILVGASILMVAVDIKTGVLIDSIRDNLTGLSQFFAGGG